MNTLTGIIILVGILVVALIIWKVVSFIVAILLPLLLLATIGAGIWWWVKRSRAAQRR